MNIKRYTKEYEDLAKQFSCGNSIIDNFLHDGSALDVNRGITYIMLSDDMKCIIGYYNIENGRVDRVENVGDSDIFELMGGAININYLAYHLYHVRNGYENFEDDMNTVVQESDMGCHKLYKWVDDII